MPANALLFVALAVLAQHFPLTLGPKLKTNASLAVYFAALLVCGAPLAMLVAFAAQLVGGLTLSFFRRNRQTGTRTRGMPSVWFNTAQISLAVGLAGVVYYAFEPHLAPARFAGISNIITLPFAGATQYLVNSGAVAGMVALQQSRNPVTVWLRGRAAAARTAAGLLCVGVAMAVMARDNPWSPLLLVPVAVVLQFALRWALERIEERRALHEMARQREWALRTALLPPTTPDHDLAEALAVGNPQALAGLYDRYGTDAYRVARSILGDNEGITAESVVLTVFLHIWQSSATGGSVPEAPRQWLLDLVRAEAMMRRPLHAGRASRPAAVVTAPR